MFDDRELVPIATYENLSGAEFARSLLAAEGIATALRDEPLASLLPPVAIANGGLTLLVAPDEADRAREVLAQPDDTDAEAEPEVDRLAEPEASGDAAQ
jgi:hypothetical protein